MSGYIENQKLLNAIDGNVSAYLEDMDRAERVICTCGMCECQVTEEQELCDRCKDLTIENEITSFKSKDQIDVSDAGANGSDSKGA